MLLVIAASVVITYGQVAAFKAQEATATNIERAAGSLNSIAIDYFLYQEDYLELPKWNQTLSTLSDDLANLKVNNLEQEQYAHNVAQDLENLNVTFDAVVAYLHNASRTVSIRIDPAFQIRWSNMAVQIQALAFDSSQLSTSLDTQAHHANDVNTMLIVALAATFGAFLISIYLLIFRKTLKSVGALQDGINTIGKGNLDYTIKIQGQNEITELSQAFNQMTANLKTVTASKTELEHEIAARKIAEVALRESEQRWATTLSSVGDAVIATDTLGKITFMNSVAESLTGWTLREAAMRPVNEIFKIVNEQTRLEVENPVTKVLEKGMIVGLANHTVLIQKNKTEIPIDDSGAPIKNKEGETTGVVLIFRDITERKKVDNILRENEVKFRTVADFTYDWEYWIAPDGHMIYVSPSCQRVTGYSVDDFMKDHTLLSKIIHPDDKSTMRPHFDVINSEEVHDANFRIITQKGETRWISHTCRAVFGDKGKWIGRRASNRDITEKKIAEEEIKESEERFSKAFHKSPTPQIIICCIDSRYVDANESFLRLFGYNREEIVGHTSAELNLIPSEKGRYAINGEKELYDYETELQTKPGKIITVLASTETIYINGQKHLINSFNDVTLHKQMQAKLEEYNKHLENLVEERTKQLKDKERLAAIGETAGMVGHDVRNPLQAITSDLYLAKTELEALPDGKEKKNIEESLGEIERNVDYINKIVADLQDFARPLKPHLEETDLKLIVDDVLKRSHMPKEITATVEVDSSATKIVSDFAYLNRILFNLVTNAMQAMPNGGKLAIKIYPDKKTGQTIITVKDTGVGIPESAKKKLFTPMFTTKSKGQGFGLVVIKRMAEALSGTVTFESKEGKGTTFIVRLPKKTSEKT